MTQTFADPGARELRARLAKARAMSKLLLHFGYTGNLVAMMGPEDWATVAKCAKVNPPHSEDTIRMVIEMVEGRR